MRIFAIETSCDETSIALVEAEGGVKNPRFKVLKNIVSSQIAIHRPFGGVVPMLAKREHLHNLPKLWKQLKKEKPKFDVIAVTVGPGLSPALWAGIEFAKSLAKELNKPLLGANHMEGHLYSAWLPRASGIEKKSKVKSGKVEVKFPAVALVVSGGHTMLLAMESPTRWENLGETRDDAAGEAFDKVARLIGLPYPGGPEIQKLSVKGNPKAINFPRPMLREKNPAKAGARGARYEFSFSGIKTAVLYYLRDLKLKTYSLKLKADVAASFQQAVIDVLVYKTMRAAREYGAKSILLSGGVSANKLLRETLAQESKKLRAEFFVPDFEFNTDNAAMIAAAAYMQKLRKKSLKMEAQPNLSL